MKSASRIILDTYNQLLNLGGTKLRVTSADKVKDYIERINLLQAGSHRGSNALEELFNGTAFANCDYDWPDAELIRLKNVWLTRDQGQIFLDDGSFFEPWAQPYKREMLKISRPLRIGVRRIKEPVFHLTGRNHDNRGHFMLEHLPKLMAARDYLLSLPDYRILVAPGHSRWQSRYVDFVGLDPAKVIEGTQGTLRVDDLFFVPSMFYNGELNAPHFFQEISRRAAETPTPQGTGKSLFITRRDAPNKQIENEEEIIDILRSRVNDVDVIRLGEHSMAQQISMFRSAPMIIGGVGQGLCNILFSHKTLCVVLSPGSGQNSVYGTKYTCQVARHCGNAAVTLHSGEYVPAPNNWSFPPARFSDLLDRLLLSPEASALCRQ